MRELYVMLSSILQVLNFYKLVLVLTICFKSLHAWSIIQELEADRHKGHSDDKILVYRVSKGKIQVL